MSHVWFTGLSWLPESRQADAHVMRYAIAILHARLLLLVFLQQTWWSINSSTIEHSSIRLASPWYRYRSKPRPWHFFPPPLSFTSWFLGVVLFLMHVCFLPCKLATRIFLCPRDGLWESHDLARGSSTDCIAMVNPESPRFRGKTQNNSMKDEQENH